MKLFHRRQGSTAVGGLVEFDADGKVTRVEMPPSKWGLEQKGPTRYFTQKATSLLQATELLKAVESVPPQTYYTVETPDGALSRDIVGFYTEAPIKTHGLALAVSAPFTDTVDSVSLTAFGDDLKSMSAVASLKQQGQYATFVLLMECGHCGYKSPVETTPGPTSRECYCCGATNACARGTVNVATMTGMVAI